MQIIIKKYVRISNIAKELFNAKQSKSIIENACIIMQMQEQESDGRTPLINQQKHDFKFSRRMTLMSNYDPSTFPPDLILAEEHGRAQAVGQYIEANRDVQRCKCCLEPTDKKQLPLLCQLSDFTHIGVCYPLYFYFIKLCIGLLLMNVLITSVPAVVINLTQGGMCKDLDGFLSDFYASVCNVSVINIMNVEEIDMLQIEAIFNFIAILLSILLIAYLNILMENKYVALSQGLRAADFSVMFKGLPKDITIYEIQKFVEDKLTFLGAEDNTIVKIYIIYNLKTIYSLYAKKRQLVDELPRLDSEHRAYMRKVRHTHKLEQKASFLTKAQGLLQEVGQHEDKIELIDIEINNYEESFKQLAQMLRDENILEGGVKGYELDFSGKCIVTLNNLKSRKVLVQDKRRTGFLQNLGYKLGQVLGGKGGTLVVSNAPEPSDIIFSNMGSEKMLRWRNQILVTLIITFFIALDFCLLTFSKKFLKEEKAINSENIIFSFVNSQVIALFNSILSRVIRLFENSSFHTTQSSYYYAVTHKLVFLFLINMLITTFFSNVVSFYFFHQDSATYDIFPLNFQGYLFDVFFLMVTNPFITIFLLFLDHRQGSKLYKKFRIQNGLIVTQAEANSAYENMPIDISSKYGNIYRFLIFSAGIACIYPLAFPLCLLILTAFYWVDKYLLLRRYVAPCKLGYRATRKMQKILGLFPVLMATTNLIVMFIPVKHGAAFEEGNYSKVYYYLALTAALVSLFFYFVGNQSIKIMLECVLRVKRNYAALSEENEHVKYKDIEQTLTEDYWHHYPYFRVSKHDKKSTLVRTDSSDSLSTRKSKIDQLHKKMTLNVFGVIQDHLFQKSYAPNV